MKTIFKLLFLTIVLIGTFSSYGQHAIIVAHSTSLKSHNGFLVLNTSDTLYGRIKLNQSKKNSWGITIETGSGKQFIADKNLKYVRLFDYDSTLITTKYTEYKILTDKPELWRHIASGKIDIYDDVLYCNEVKDKIGDNLRVIDSGQVKNITHTFSFFVSDDLLKYTNNKHKTKYKTRDFKSDKDLLIFVADKG